MTSTIESPAHPSARTVSGAPSPLSTRAAREDRSTTTAALFERVAQTCDEDERRGLLDDLVTLNMGVARSIAARYRGRGVSDDDLAQVAYVGLVRAVHAFDPSFDRDFLVYAVPTIRGEVRKYFRDRAWAVRPPRRLQELQPRLALAREELGQQLGRSPRAEEVADHLGVDVEEVIEALATNGCFSPTSLDRPIGEDGIGTLSDLLGGEDTQLDAAEARLMLAPVMESLSERDRRIVYLRFFSQLTQREIAEDIGVTQMQVSRLLTRILSQLRRALEA